MLETDEPGSSCSVAALRRWSTGTRTPAHQSRALWLGAGGRERREGEDRRRAKSGTTNPSQALLDNPIEAADCRGVASRSSPRTAARVARVAWSRLQGSWPLRPCSSLQALRSRRGQEVWLDSSQLQRSPPARPPAAPTDSSASSVRDFTTSKVRTHGAPYRTMALATPALLENKSSAEIRRCKLRLSRERGCLLRARAHTTAALWPAGNVRSAQWLAERTVMLLPVNRRGEGLFFGGNNCRTCLSFA